KEDVAELVQELAVVAAVRGVGQLVGLLDRVRDDRPLVLLAVPRALDPQAPGDLIEAQQRRLDVLAVGARAFAGAHRRPYFVDVGVVVDGVLGAVDVAGAVPLWSGAVPLGAGVAGVGVFGAL